MATASSNNAERSYHHDIPDHVPREVVFDFDMYMDSRFSNGLYEAYMQVQREAPGFFYTPRNGGHWVAIRHKDVLEVAQNADGLFTSWRQGIPRPPEDLMMPRMIPVDMDGEEHRKYRRILAPIFSPVEVAKMEGKIRELAIDLIEGIKNSGQAEFVEAIGIPMPVKFFMSMMGMPLERYKEFVEWVDRFFNTNDTDTRTDVGFKIYVYLDELIKDRQVRPQDDLISKIIAAEVDGERIPYEIVMGMCTLLFVGGLDTLTNAMSFIVRYLALNPDKQMELRNNPKIIPEAVEELLRRFAFANSIRMVLDDCTFNGIQLKKGDPVLLCFPMAGLDDQIIENPGSVDFARPVKTHFVFGGGQHRCAGSHLARLELKIMLEEFFKRIPQFTQNETATFRPGIVSAIRNVKLRW